MMHWYEPGRVIVFTLQGGGAAVEIHYTLGVWRRGGLMEIVWDADRVWMPPQLGYSLRSV